MFNILLWCLVVYFLGVIITILKFGIPKNKDQVLITIFWFLLLIPENNKLMKFETIEDIEEWWAGN